MASAFWTIARFDFARRLRMVSTWVYFVLYVVIAGLWMAAAGGAISGAGVSFGGDKILINGTNALAIAIGVLGFTGITVIGSVAGRAVQQDFEVGIHPLFFSADHQARVLSAGRSRPGDAGDDLSRHRHRHRDRLALAGVDAARIAARRRGRARAAVLSC
jgi:hypothetical protein